MSNNPLIIVIGAYGSGKSEYSINLAKQLKMVGADGKNLNNLMLGDNIYKGSDKISLVDLDVVNPYFRSREVKEIFEKKGIEVIAPDSKYNFADLPMISPRVKGAINDLSKTVILDVGGDPAGCRALGRFTDDVKQRPYEMIFVVNTKRPFTAEVKEIIEMKNMLEKISNLKITEIICNTNLMEYTDIKMISEGIAIVKEVAEKECLIFRNYLVMTSLSHPSTNRDVSSSSGAINIDDGYPDEIDGIKKMNLEYFLAKPWEL